MLKNLRMVRLARESTEYEKQRREYENAYFGIMSVQRVSLDVVFRNISFEMDARW